MARQAKRIEMVSVRLHKSVYHPSGDVATSDLRLRLVPTALENGALFSSYSRRTFSAYSIRTIVTLSQPPCLHNITALTRDARRPKRPAKSTIGSVGAAVAPMHHVVLFQVFSVIVHFAYSRCLLDDGCSTYGWDGCGIEFCRCWRQEAYIYACGARIILMHSS